MATTEEAYGTAALLEQLRATVERLIGIGASPDEVVTTVSTVFDGIGHNPISAALTRMHNAESTIARLDIDNTGRKKMHEVIDRLLAAAPKLEPGPGQPPDPQTPAMQAQVVLRNGYQVMGALSTTPEGALRLLTVAQGQDPSNPTARPVAITAEHFFDYDDVVAVILVAKLEQSSIRPVGGGLILPG